MNRTGFDTEILIYAVGYEARSRYVVENVASLKRIAVVFERHDGLSFATNLSAARSRGDVLISSESLGADLGPALAAAVKDVRGTRLKLRAVVDVSSMPRLAMATILLHMMRAATALQFQVSLAYAVARYLPPQSDPAPYMAFEPLPECEGWTAHPERPLSTVLGLGYEDEQAIATVQYLDPSGIWAFIPVGNDARFLTDLRKANRALWPILREGHLLEYRIADLGYLYATYRGLVETLCRRSRVVLVPSGPKIFSAISIVIKAQLGDEVSVWRASSYRQTDARDVAADGSISILDVPEPALDELPTND